ncbi:MAG: hypothetical protein JW795_17885 [Chitinivibrionales bacterium]|nr:hypothetical protein [Chitinivibrionales bacterium]
MQIAPFLFLINSFFFSDTLTVSADTFSIDIRQTFETHLKSLYNPEWKELENTYTKNTFRTGYEIILSTKKQFGGAYFRIVKVQTPFIQIERLGSPSPSGMPAICPELWVRNDSSFVCVSREDVDKILIAEIDNTDNIYAIMRYGCCAAEGVQIIRSMNDTNAKHKRINTIFEKYLDGPVHFDHGGKCADMIISFHSREKDMNGVIKFNCVNGTLDSIEPYFFKKQKNEYRKNQRLPLKKE